MRQSRDRTIKGGKEAPAYRLSQPERGTHNSTIPTLTSPRNEVPHKPTFSLTHQLITWDHRSERQEGHHTNKKHTTDTDFNVAQPHGHTKNSIVRIIPSPRRQRQRTPRTNHHRATHHRRHTLRSQNPTRLRGHAPNSNFLKIFVNFFKSLSANQISALRVPPG